MSEALAAPSQALSDITASGASESAWRRALHQLAPPPMRWGESGRAVVVAPHPDDEVLAVGGSMLQLVHLGFSVVVVAVTDGEAAQPEASAGERGSLSEVRIRERRTALQVLGLSELPVVRASIPDGAVEQSEQELTRILADLLESPLSRAADRGVAPTWCVAPWRGDGHPDHEATGRAAAVASARSGSRLLEYPVWAWQWLRPGDVLFPWRDLRLERLSSATQRAKGRAIGAFRSQVEPWGRSKEPILSSEMLTRFSRPFEGFLLQNGGTN